MGRTMQRIRNKPGSTHQARRHFHKCSRIGNIIKVEAVRYTAMFLSQDKTHRYPITNEVIRVTGTHGTVRLHGLCWGYGGTGPSALRDLLLFLGLKEGHARLAAFNTHRRQHSQIGVDWTLEFNTTDGLGRPGYVVLTPAEGEKRGWQRSEALVELPPVTLLGRE
jgi:hypothetical protein